MLLAFETVARTASACVCDDAGAVVEERDLEGAEAEVGLVGLLDGLIRERGRPDQLAVAGDRCETIAPTAAIAHDAPAELHPRTREATAIGPLLGGSSVLAHRWIPGIELGSSAPLRARGVALAARSVDPVSWDRVLPAYHQEPAPVLQRARKPNG